MAEMRIMGSVGDKQLTWDPEDPKSVSRARKKFADLKAKGLKAYIVITTTTEIPEFVPAIGKTGVTFGREMTEADFADPAVQQAVAVAPMAGG